MNSCPIHGFLKISIRLKFTTSTPTVVQQRQEVRYREKNSFFFHPIIHTVVKQIIVIEGTICAFPGLLLLIPGSLDELVFFHVLVRLCQQPFTEVSSSVGIENTHSETERNLFRKKVHRLFNSGESGGSSLLVRNFYYQAFMVSVRKGRSRK